MIAFCRGYSTNVARRFYKTVRVVGGDGNYEIVLDRGKLKTPAGRVFKVDNEPLALAVAAEWDAQKDRIRRESMHLTALCSTVFDNPTHNVKFDMVRYLADYLATDAVLYQSHEDDGLYERQRERWDPVIEWFCDRFDIKVEKVRGLDGPPIDSSVKKTIADYFSSCNFAAVNGFVFAVDTLKSVILTMAAAERLLTPEEAVRLSRLEEEYQCEHWGRVEWSHDLQQQDIQSRLSAALLFVHFNSSSTQRRTKNLKQ